MWDELYVWLNTIMLLLLYGVGILCLCIFLVQLIRALVDVCQGRCEGLLLPPPRDNGKAVKKD